MRPGAYCKAVDRPAKPGLPTGEQGCSEIEVAERGIQEFSKHAIER
jgi:hypothetical protein